MFKKITAILLAMITALVIMPAASAATNIVIKIDDAIVESDTAPVVINGTTLVPVRVITEYLGAKVEWDAKTSSAKVITAAHTVVFTIGSKSYTVDGVSKTLDTTVQLINNRTMIPLRALAESIGATVDYDSVNHIAIVNYFTTLRGSIKISGSTTVQPISQAAADKLLTLNQGLTISVAGGGSGTGIKETNSGANNIGMSSRVLTADEQAALSVYTIANDGIAIITNPQNPVTNLTKEQAAKIFLGEIKNWKEVGGNDAPILVQTRETGSGTLATLSELLLEKQSVVATATPSVSSALIKQAVAGNVNAIGFDSVGFVDSTVHVLSIDNIKPTAETISSGAYLLSRSLYVFTKGTPNDASAKFIDFLTSQYAQNEIIAKEGYIPVR
jgi:phosphate binding protein